MTLIERIGEAIAGGYDPNKKRLLVELYREAFPLKEPLDVNCSSCGTQAYSKLSYFYSKQNSNEMAKTNNEYRFKGLGDDDVKVFPQIGLALKNENLNEKVIGMLKKQLGADFDTHIEKVSGGKTEKA